MIPMINKSFEEISMSYEIIIVEDNSPDGTFSNCIWKNKIKILSE